MRKLSLVAAFAVLLAGIGGIAGANLSVAADHDRGPHSRPDGSGDIITRILADHMRTEAWPDHHNRECWRCRRQHWGRPGRPLRLMATRSSPATGPLTCSTAPSIPLNYDVLNDFEPISLVATESVCALRPRKDFPRDRAERVHRMAARANPGQGVGRAPPAPAASGHLWSCSFGRRRHAVPVRALSRPLRPRCRT